MSHYALAITPYGNFAVQSRHSDSPHTIESFRLTPIGELAELPLKFYNDTIGTVLDQDALRVEAARQLAARGSAPSPYLHPSPEFTVNRVHYSQELTIITRKTWNSDQPHTFVDTFYDMTDSAQSKIVAWWTEHRDEIVTPEFLALSELESARSDQRYAGERHAAAARELLEREAELDAAGQRVNAALAALHSLSAA